MDDKVNYMRVGFFVATFSVIGLLIGFWLAFGLNSKHYSDYLAYMNESVNGLSIDAAVKYNGVTVGFVREMELNLENPQQVKLILAIDNTVPVRVDTKATLMSQGLTGINIVNLTGGSLQSPILKAKPGQKLPVIETEPSFLVRADTLIQNLSISLTGVSEGLRNVLNPENREALQKILANTKQASELLPLTMQNLNQSVQLVGTQVLPQLIQTLDSAKRLTDRLSTFTNDVSEHPALLIRGRQPEKGGPGE